MIVTEFDRQKLRRPCLSDNNVHFYRVIEKIFLIARTSNARF